MVRHSKNNTNSANFTYDERRKIKAGTQSSRLNRESMKAFDSCCLCLERARAPKVCQEGHLYCSECIVTNLLYQKKDILRQEKILKELVAKEKNALEEIKEAARERMVTDFEKTQSALPSSLNNKRILPEEDDTPSKKVKVDHETALSKAIEDVTREMEEAKRAKLPNFWLPSLTPNAERTSRSAKIKLMALCQASKPPHPITLKSLISVRFTKADVDKADSNKAGSHDPYMCPACRKGLSNNVKSYIIKPCGHVLCITCVETLCKPDKACAHCSEPIKEDDVVELKREGTGYAAGGQAVATRFDLAFQG